MAQLAEQLAAPLDPVAAEAIRRKKAYLDQSAAPQLTPEAQAAQQMQAGTARLNAHIDNGGIADVGAAIDRNPERIANIQHRQSIVDKLQGVQQQLADPGFGADNGAAAGALAERRSKGVGNPSNGQDRLGKAKWDYLSSLQGPPKEKLKPVIGAPITGNPNTVGQISEMHARLKAEGKYGGPVQFQGVGKAAPQKMEMGDDGQMHPVKAPGRSTYSMLSDAQKQFLKGRQESRALRAAEARAKKALLAEKLFEQQQEMAAQGPNIGQMMADPRFQQLMNNQPAAAVALLGQVNAAQLGNRGITADTENRAADRLQRADESKLQWESRLKMLDKTEEGQNTRHSSELLNRTQNQQASLKAQQDDTLARINADQVLHTERLTAAKDQEALNNAVRERMQKENITADQALQSLRNDGSMAVTVQQGKNALEAIGAQNEHTSSENALDRTATNELQNNRLASTEKIAGNDLAQRKLEHTDQNALATKADARQEQLVDPQIKSIEAETAQAEETTKQLQNAGKSSAVSQYLNGLNLNGQDAQNAGGEITKGFKEAMEADRAAAAGLTGQPARPLRGAEAVRAAELGQTESALPDQSAFPPMTQGGLPATPSRAPRTVASAVSGEAPTATPRDTSKMSTTELVAANAANNAPRTVASSLGVKAAPQKTRDMSPEYRPSHDELLKPPGTPAPKSNYSIAEAKAALNEPDGITQKAADLLGIPAENLLEIKAMDLAREIKHLEDNGQQFTNADYDVIYDYVDAAKAGVENFSTPGSGFDDPVARVIKNIILGGNDYEKATSEKKAEEERSMWRNWTGILPSDIIEAAAQGLKGDDFRNKLKISDEDAKKYLKSTGFNLVQKLLYGIGGALPFVGDDITKSFHEAETPRRELAQRLGLEYDMDSTKSGNPRRKNHRNPNSRIRK